MLFPPGTKLSVRVVKEPITIVLLKISNRIALCDESLFGKMWRNVNVTNVRHSHLVGNRMIRTYMELLVENLIGPLHCYRYMENSILGLLHYLRGYYTAEELAGFNRPLISPDVQFMFFIWNNYRKVNNVTQFAQLSNCSLSNFKIKFKHVTGMSPSEWMNEQKARGVYHEIVNGEKSFKEISDEFHFSSLSHMGTFCRKHFGDSPGILRMNLSNTKKRRAPVAVL
jgi:AraC-like DNA-binding protein